MARTAFSKRAARLTVGGALACVAAIGALAIFNGGSNGGGALSAFATAAIKVAKANPRLLITAPGWSVKHGYGFEADTGRLIFINEEHRKVELDWYPAHEYRSRLRDRAAVSPPVKSTLLGQRATTVHYAEEGAADYATILAPQGAGVRRAARTALEQAGIRGGAAVTAAGQRKHVAERHASRAGLEEGPRGRAAPDATWRTAPAGLRPSDAAEPRPSSRSHT